MEAQAGLILLLCAVYLGGGSASGTLTWCLGDYDMHHLGAPNYPYFLSGLEAAVNATVAASDRTALAAGTPPDAALGQCRPDVPAGECSRCLGVLRAGILGGTTCQAGGARDGICLLRYDVNSDFSGFDQGETTDIVYDDATRARPRLTKDVVEILLSRVAAANATTNGSRTVAGIANYPDGNGTATLYALVQCITQLSAPDCSRCLSGALFRLSEQFNSSAGMLVLRPSCMLNYNSTLFFNTSLLPVINVSIPAAASPSPSSQPGSPTSSKNRDLRIGISLGAVASVLVLAAALSALCWFARRNRRSRTPTGGGNYRYEDLVVATNNFSDENKLGSGRSGVVYKGLLENKQEIAVKKLMTSMGLTEFQREVSLVAQLQHENLVKFLGHSFQKDRMFLVYEYLANKELRNYFKDSDDSKKLDWPKWFNIIEGIARGLNYLHKDSGKNIIHRDLKPCNILLDSSFTAKIADFDLAREYNRDKSHESTQKVAGTFGYIAPECVSGKQFSTKSDVYSYGVVVLSIIVGHSIHAFEAESSTDLVKYVWLRWDGGRVEEMLDRDHLGIVTDEQMQQALRCVHVALLCVQKDKNRRPAMEEVVHFLNIEMHLENYPSAPGFFSLDDDREGIAPGFFSLDDREGIGYSVNGLTVSRQEPR